jgi:hypothetical protein
MAVQFPFWAFGALQIWRYRRKAIGHLSEHNPEALQALRDGSRPCRASRAERKVGRGGTLGGMRRRARGSRPSGDGATGGFEGDRGAYLRSGHSIRLPDGSDANRLGAQPADPSSPRGSGGASPPCRARGSPHWSAWTPAHGDARYAAADLVWSADPERRGRPRDRRPAARPRAGPRRR